MKITYTEKKVMDFIWEKEPVKSKHIVEYCKNHFDWKNTTTFTFLKRLENKGIIVNNSSIVSSLISKNDIEQDVSREFVQDAFNDSLPSFLAAFLNGKRLSDKDYKEIKKLIDEHRKGK